MSDQYLYAFQRGKSFFFFKLNNNYVTVTKSEERSRREIRKKARLEKKAQIHEARLQHQVTLYIFI